jgi:hypothetical protein
VQEALEMPPTLLFLLMELTVLTLFFQLLRQLVVVMGQLLLAMVTLVALAAADVVQHESAVQGLLVKEIMVVQAVNPQVVDMTQAVEVVVLVRLELPLLVITTVLAEQV